MPVIQLDTNNTRVRLFEQNESIGFSDMNKLAGSDQSDSSYDHLINLSLAMMGQFDGTTPRPLGFKVSFAGNQVTIGKGIVVRNDGIFKFAGGVFTVNAAAGSGIYEVEMSTLFDTPTSKEYINILTETISTAIGNTRKNFQLRLYENYVAGTTPPPVTSGRLKICEYITTAPSGSIVTVQNPITVFETNNGKVPLTGVTYVFDAAYAPASGIVNSDGFMRADGATVPSGNALAGWVTPNLVDGSYIEGATVPSLANVGSNSKVLTPAELAEHGHSMSHVHPMPHTHGLSGSSATPIVTDLGAITNPSALPSGYSLFTGFGGDNSIVSSIPDQTQLIMQKATVNFSGNTNSQSTTDTGDVSTPNTGTQGANQAFDLRSARKQGIPLIRVN